MQQICNTPHSCYAFPPPLRFLCFLHRRSINRRLSLNLQISCPRICVVSRSTSARAHEARVVDAAWEILDMYNKNDVKGSRQPSLQSHDGLFALAASVVVAVDAALAEEGRRPMLGICASDAEEAIRALREWATALGCEFLMPEILDAEHDLKTIPGPVYIKYNPQSQVSFLKPYNGMFRGVIAQIGQRQVGHLPLSLFNQESFVQNQKFDHAGMNIEEPEQE